MDEVINENANQTKHGIGWAVKQLLNGSKVARENWNGKNQFLFLFGESSFTAEGVTYDTRPYVAIKPVDDRIAPWICSATDLLATDWNIVG